MGPQYVAGGLVEREQTLGAVNGSWLGFILVEH